MSIIPNSPNGRKWLCRLVLLAFFGVFQFIVSTNIAVAESKQSPWLNQAMTLADARHLLGRTGFGASPEELYHYTKMNRLQAVQAIVDGLQTEPAVEMPDWVQNPATLYWTRRYMDNSERQEFNAARNREISDLRQWWVSNILQTDSPQTERLVLFWHDHFATSYEGVNQRSVAMARQNQLFRQFTKGSYKDFLKAIIRDPAMLEYLDNRNNRKQKPNENFARELLELFTLGEGKYSESTVKEAARALTGYSFSDVNNVKYRFDDHKHDDKSKTLFGITKNHTGDTLIDAILEQPAAAEFIVEKFWHAYISDAPPADQFVASQAKSFRDSDYDLQQLYTSIISSAEFWSFNNRLAIIKSPATLLFGTARSLEFPKHNWYQIPSLLSSTGMTLFAPPNVSGWREGEAFIAPGRLLNRQIALDTLLAEPSGNAPKNNTMMMADNAGNMMSTPGETGMSSSMQGEAQSDLQVRMAAHLYLGAPLYKIELVDNDKMLWASAVQELSVGYDTERFGEMQDENALSWVFNGFQPSASHMAKATHVVIHFLNDAAGKNGDRNLFIDGVQFNGQWYSASGTEQQSACVPKNKKNAGNLYCQGKVTIPVSAADSRKAKRSSDFSASDVNLWWKNRRNNKLSLIAIYQNVQTPERFFHNLTVHLESKNKNQLRLQLNADGCIPDCVQEWPECAWFDKRNPEQKSLSFPIKRSKDKNLNCHYDSLSSADKALVDALWVSVPNMVDHLASTINGRSKEQQDYTTWSKRLSAVKRRLKRSQYAKQGQLIQIDNRYKPEEKSIQPLHAPGVNLSNLSEFENTYQSAKLSLTELLIGGIDVSVFPELQKLDNSNYKNQLNSLVKHPVYQVY